MLARKDYTFFHRERIIYLSNTLKEAAITIDDDENIEQVNKLQLHLAVISQISKVKLNYAGKRLTF
jgi:hypothetical protein